MVAAMASTSLLAWLDAPASDRGIRFAHPGDGWDWWPYERLAALTCRVAGGLVDAGVRPGDVVAVVERSRPAFLAALFGALRVGAPPSPLAPPPPLYDPAAYAEQLGARLAGMRPALLACGAGLGDAVFGVAAAAGVPLVVGIDAL